MGFFSSSKKTAFPWVELTSSEQLHDLIASSEQEPVLFFKHSTRCSISSMALSRFENNWNTAPEKCTCVYLDLIAYRALSNELEEITRVIHQSPQAILMNNKTVIYEATHSAIDASAIQKLI
jgi:bacillithiol system protein YtxJ